jgi:predicted MFS family arabinose efflux permease
LSTVPLTTKFIGDQFGQRYLGTLVSITFVGHQIGAFLGAYVGGLVYDATHNYMRLWYASLALSVFAVVMNFFAGREPVNLRRRGLA